MRNRIVHPGLFESEILGTGPELSITVFVGLTMMADREGRFKWRPPLISSTLFPYRQVDVTPILEFLAQHHLIVHYAVAGEHYGYFPNWRKYQHIHAHEAASRIPCPDNVDTCSDNVETCIDNVNQDSRSTQVILSTVSTSISTCTSKKNPSPKNKSTKVTSNPPAELFSPEDREYVTVKLGRDIGEYMIKAVQDAHDVNPQKFWKNYKSPKHCALTWYRLKCEQGHEWDGQRMVKTNGYRSNDYQQRKQTIMNIAKTYEEAEHDQKRNSESTSGDLFGIPPRRS